MDNWEKLYQSVKDLEDKYYELATTYMNRDLNNPSFMYDLAKATAFQAIRNMMEDMGVGTNEKDK